MHAIPGMVPRPDQFPAGCRFAPRCSYAQDACTAAPVPMRDRSPGDGPTSRQGRQLERVTLARCVRQDELVLSGPPADLGARTVAEPHGRDRHPSSEAEAPVLEVTDLVKDFPLRSGVLRRITGTVRAVDEVSLRIDAGNDPRPGGRERLGQVHPGPAGAPPHRPDQRDDRRRRQGHHLAARTYAPPAPRDDAVGLPGPVLVARPQAEHRRHRRGASGHPHLDEQGRAGAAGGAAPGPGRAGFARPVSVSPTSSPAGSASASPSHGRSRSSPGCSSATSRSARSTSPRSLR